MHIFIIIISDSMIFNSYRYKTWAGGLATIIIFILIIVYFVLLIVQPIKLVASSFGDFISSTSSNTNTTNSSGQITTSGDVSWNVGKKMSYVDLHSTRQTSNKTVVPFPNWYFGFKLSKDYDPTYIILYLYQAVYDGKGFYYGTISFDK